MNVINAPSKTAKIVRKDGVDDAKNNDKKQV